MIDLPPITEDDVYPPPRRSVRTVARAVALATGAAALTVTLAGTLSACSSSGGAAASNGPTSPTISPTTPARAIPPASKITEVPELRNSIALTTCKSADGGWSASGTAKNPGQDSKTYHLLVFFNDKYSRTIDYARTDVTVAGGATKSWTATAKFDASDGTTCVLRGLSQS